MQYHTLLLFNNTYAIIIFMSNPEKHDSYDNESFTTFDEMVLIGDLQEVETEAQLEENIRQTRIRLKGMFALSLEQGLEEEEEPEED